MATRPVNTAMNVLGAAAAGLSYLSLGTKTDFDNKVGQFYAHLHKHSIARPNRFEVRFNLPRILNPIYNGTEDVRLLTLRCDTAVVPSVALVGNESVYRYGYGPTEFVPFNATKGAFSCSFIADSEGLIHKFFYRWINGIVKSDQKPTTSGFSSYNGLRPFEVEYKSDYSTIVNLLTYNESNDQLLTYDFVEAFPIGIGEIQYGWNDNDTFVRIPVQFAYTYYQMANVDEEIKLSQGRETDLGLIGKLLKTGTAIQTIRAIKRPQSVGDVINVVNNAKVILTNI